MGAQARGGARTGWWAALLGATALVFVLAGPAHAQDLALSTDGGAGAGALEPGGSAAEARPEVLHCPRCQSPYTPGTERCPVCLMRLDRGPQEAAAEAGTTYCPRCDNPYPANLSRCPYCLMPTGVGIPAPAWVAPALTFVPEAEIRLGAGFLRIERSRPGFESTLDVVDARIGLDLWADLHTRYPIGAVLRYELSAFGAGTEEGDLQGTGDVENAIDRLSHRGEIGVTFPFDLLSIRWTPFAAFTFEREETSRSRFEEDGQPVQVTDLDGRAQRSVDEVRDYLGPTFGLRVGRRFDDLPIEVVGWAAYTFYPTARIDHEIFGSFDTTGEMLRAEAGAYYVPSETFRAGITLGIESSRVETTSPEVRTGQAAQVIAQIPGLQGRSVVCGVEVRLRF